MIPGVHDIVSEMGSDFMEELHPILDDYHLIRLKIQQMKAKGVIVGDQWYEDLAETEK
jgi:hypothetical protein